MSGPWEKYQQTDKSGPWNKYKNTKPNPDGTYGQPPEGMVLNPNTGQMTSRDLMKNNIEPSRLDAVGKGFMQGFSLNSTDEGFGVVSDFARERFRAEDEAAQDAFPKTYAASQVAGAVTSPVTKAGGGITTVRGAAALGAGEAAVDSFNRGEGDFATRLENVPRDALTGLFFAGGTSAALKGGTAGFRKLFTKSQKRPSIANLKATKNAAYRAVEEAGEEFGPQEMQAMTDWVVNTVGDVNFDEAADPQTAAALRLLERRSGETMTLSRLDKIRQTFWDRYSRSDEPGLLDAIKGIDELIGTRAESSELMRTARAANSRYAKAQLLENAFRKARLQTAATGSGGNILNKYRQAVTRIITTPKEARFFSDDEIKLMEAFVTGNDVENTLRRAGKLSPGGNGLMTALNVYAAAVDPAMLGITAAATAAKETADRSAMKGSERILDSVATGVINKPPKPVPLSGAAAASGVVLPEYLRDRHGR